jgi:hypothetical protein
MKIFMRYERPFFCLQCADDRPSPFDDVMTSNLPPCIQRTPRKATGLESINTTAPAAGFLPRRLVAICYGARRTR